MDTRSNKHVLQLQRELQAQQQVINDLVRENFELKGLLNYATHAQHSERSIRVSGS